MTTNTYLIKEGYNNLNKHGSKTISTMLIICATMLILGIFIIILQNVNQNVQTLRLEQGLQAFIEDKSTDEDVAYMEDQIKLIDGVSQVQYMSKSEAYEDAKQQFKDQDYFLDGLEGLDIFPASFNISKSSTSKNLSILVDQSSIVIGMCLFALFSAKSKNAETISSKLSNSSLLK